jgi:hypothetical protein
VTARASTQAATRPLAMVRVCGAEEEARRRGMARRAPPRPPLTSSDTRPGRRPCNHGDHAI